MSTNGLEIRGLNQVQRLLINLAPKAKQEIKTITRTVGLSIQADAKRRVVVDTGALKGSINYVETKSGYGAEVKTDSKYWVYVEMGTGGLVSIPSGFEDLAAEFKGTGVRQVNLPARPFLIPAYMVHRDLYYKMIQDAISRILR